MSAAFAKVIAVKRSAKDGWIIYTCEALPGLFLASDNCRQAYDELPGKIQTALMLDHGANFLVTHKTNYAEFTRRDDALLSLQGRRPDADSSTHELLYFTLQRHGHLTLGGDADQNRYTKAAENMSM